MESSFTVILIFVTISRECISQQEESFRNKCCPWSQHLNASFLDCVPSRQLNSSDTLAWDYDLFRARPGIWLPCEKNRTLLAVAQRDLDRINWLENGSLLLRSPTAKGATRDTVLPIEDFCIDTFEDPYGQIQRAVLMCPCRAVQCIYKCCDVQYVMTCYGLTCECEQLEKLHHHLGEETYKESWLPFNNTPIETDFAYEILAGYTPVCPENEILLFDNPLYRPFHIVKEWWNYPEGHLFELKECIDLVNYKNKRTYHSVGYCYAKPPFEHFVHLLSSLHVPSVILLLITLILLLLSEKPTTVHGYVHGGAIRNHVLALIITNTILGVYSLVEDDTDYCTITPLIMYFCLMAAAFWLNVIWINMALGFSNPQGAKPDCASKGRKLYLLFSLYAWGVPGAMTAFTAAMWYAPSIPGGLQRPTLMETRRCLWEDETGDFEKSSTFYYYYGPVCGLLFINLSLFMFISRQVFRLRRDTSFAHTNTLESHQTQRGALLYAKLLWLMGAAEMALELTAWAAYRGGLLYHLLADVLDLLRAVAVFASSACGRRNAFGRARERLLQMALQRRSRPLPPDRSSRTPTAATGNSKTCS